MEEADSVRLDAGLHRGEGDILLVHGIHRSILHRFIRGIQTLTRCHNALLANLRAGLGGELVALGAFPSGRRLVDVNSVRPGALTIPPPMAAARALRAPRSRTCSRVMRRTLNGLGGGKRGDKPVPSPVHRGNVLRSLCLLP